MKRQSRTTLVGWDASLFKRLGGEGTDDYESVQ